MNDENFSRGDLVRFTVNGESLPRKGEVRSNPQGRHRKYKVRTFTGDLFEVPQVLLERLSN